MRGVYSCGKSTRAKELAGKTGKVLEEDAYHEEPCKDGFKYKYRPSETLKAQKHVSRELKRAMKSGISPIVIDRDNAPSCPHSRKLMELVIKYGYTPKLAEPVSELWQTLRAMMENKNKFDAKSFSEIASKLYFLSQNTHKLTTKQIYDRIMIWPVNVNIDDFLNYQGK